MTSLPLLRLRLSRSLGQLTNPIGSTFLSIRAVYARLVGLGVRKRREAGRKGSKIIYRAFEVRTFAHFFYLVTNQPLIYSLGMKIWLTVWQICGWMLVRRLGAIAATGVREF